jgi:hypothetical protein
MVSFVVIALCLFAAIGILICDSYNNSLVDSAVERLLRSGAIMAQRLPTRVERDQIIVQLGNETATLYPNDIWVGDADSEILAELSPFTFDQIIGSMPRLGEMTGAFTLYVWGNERRLKALRPKTSHLQHVSA